MASPEDGRAALARALARCGLEGEGEGERVGSIRHVFTHRDVTAEVVRQRVRGQASTAADARWVEPGALAGLALSTFTRKTLSLLWPAGTALELLSGRAGQ
jgi:adenine-specific DNA glycosylase